MLHSLRRARVALLAAVALILAGCESSTAVRTGQLSLLLTDAPGDIQQAVVTIDQIYLQGSENGGRIILRDEDVTTDLLTLVNDTQSLIEGVEIPVGTYGQLRFVISGGYIAVEGEDGSSLIYASSPTYAGLPDGATVHGELMMPSFAQSGLKVNLPNDAIRILEDELVVLVVDFDVAESFGKQAGNSGKWVMSPVLKGMLPTQE